MTSSGNSLKLLKQLHPGNFRPLHNYPFISIWWPRNIPILSVHLWHWVPFSQVFVLCHQATNPGVMAAPSLVCLVALVMGVASSDCSQHDGRAHYEHGHRCDLPHSLHSHKAHLRWRGVLSKCWDPVLSCKFWFRKKTPWNLKSTCKGFGASEKILQDPSPSFPQEMITSWKIPKFPSRSYLCDELPIKGSMECESINHPAKHRLNHPFGEVSWQKKSGTKKLATSMHASMEDISKKRAQLTSPYLDPSLED